MIVIKCNRCGAEIGPLPDSITQVFPGAAGADHEGRPRHLCDRCFADLERFMAGALLAPEPGLSPHCAEGNHPACTGCPGCHCHAEDLDVPRSLWCVHGDHETCAGLSCPCHCHEPQHAAADDPEAAT